MGVRVSSELRRVPVQKKEMRYHVSGRFIVDSKRVKVAEIIGQMFSPNHIDRAIDAAIKNNAKLYLVTGETWEKSKFFFKDGGKPVFFSKDDGKPILGICVIRPLPRHGKDPRFISTNGSVGGFAEFFNE